MPKMKLVLSVMVIVGLVIIGEAVFIFTRPEKLTLLQAGVLVGLALAALVLLMITLWQVFRALNKKS